MPSAEQLRSRLMKKLAELFQLDQPDLDFGFYRIMHAKAKEVREFIDTDLLKIVAEAFGQVDGARKAELQAVYDKAIQTAIDFGAPKPEETEPVKKAKSALDAIQDSISHEADVYDHLYRFFERYYDDGDFISRRYYTRETTGKAAPFAIPYNGEEVKLHWANADQYYIKSSEYFSNYTFDLMQAKEVLAAGSDGLLAIAERQEKILKVHFRVIDATEGEHGNVKTSDANKRFFLIHADQPVDLTEDSELVINFEYRPDLEKSGQENTWRDKRNAEAVDTILSRLEVMAQDANVSEDEKAKVLGEYLLLLKIAAPTDKDTKRPLLAKYINQYTARNTMDYFIHKDLGGFLYRELDFYIKNEVMHLDDIENAEVPSVESYLAKIRVLRKIAGKLIDFLAQLEDFQKKLWLKKKFVIETNYCITLDRVPEDLYLEVAANEAQCEEWIKLFAIDEIQVDLPNSGFSRPLTTEFLKTNNKLVLDTRFFNGSFKARLVASIEDFDKQCGGLLIHSENFQALNLLQERYREQVNCVYIDPPYNTGQDGFPYKDAYKSSSWITMMGDRLSVSRKYLKDKGVLFCSINEIERDSLVWQLKNVFDPDNRVEELIWIQDTVSNNAPLYSTNHEYIEVFANNRASVERCESTFRESRPGYTEVIKIVERLSAEYASISEIESEIDKLYKSHANVHLQEEFDRGIDAIEGKKSDPWKGLYPYKYVEYRDNRGRLVQECDAKQKNAKPWVWRKVEPSMPSGKQADTTRDSHSENYRFYTPPHPETGLSCKAPKRGWAFPQKKIGNRPSLESYMADDRIWFGDGSSIPQQKYFLHEVESVVGTSVIRQYADGEPQLEKLFGEKGLVPNPKPPALIEKLIQQASEDGDLIFDFFGGSGTTGQAAIDVVRKFGGKREYMLVEMGSYFYTALLPRIKKSIFSGEWQAGKPMTRKTGISHCLKYIRLESYEDTLNNLRFDHNPQRKKAVAANPALKDDYMLRYFLDVETRGSQSLLNIDAFADPTAYTLDVKKPGKDEYATRAVDLIETFNYLIGLRVLHTSVPQSFRATFKRITDPELPEDQHTKLVVDGRIRQDAEGPWWFRKVEGWVPKDPVKPNNGVIEKVLIVWRKLTGDIEQDNLMLDEWFQKNRISSRDFEFDTIYVNGSNNLPNLKLEGESWKVRLIEEEFMKRIWEAEA